MKALSIVLLGVMGAVLAFDGPAGAQTNNTPADQPPPSADQRPFPANQRPSPAARRAPELQAIEKLNAWTVGLAGGQLEGAPIRFATEIARVVDDGDNLHVLPIVTRGPAENVEALLYLKGVDAAIINSDALEQFKALVPNIRQRITYILNLFPSELHIFVRPEIKSLDDLKGKKVNFNTPGTAAAYSGPLIFERLKLDVDKTFIPHQVALEQMRAGQGDMEAVVFVTSKPIDAFQRGKWDPGFKFLAVPFEDFELLSAVHTDCERLSGPHPAGPGGGDDCGSDDPGGVQLAEGIGSLQAGRAADGQSVQSVREAAGAGFSPQVEGCQPQCEGARAGPLPGGAGVARQMPMCPDWQ